MKEIAVIHALKIFREGDAHLDGTVSVFNAHQDSILDDAKRFNSASNIDGKRNYKVLAIVMMSYKSNDATVWTDSPIGESCRWESNESESL